MTTYNELRKRYQSAIYHLDYLLDQYQHREITGADLNMVYDFLKTEEENSPTEHDSNTVNTTLTEL